LPKKLVKKYFGKFGLAILIMDDGTKEGSSIRINTQSFTKNENLWLSKFLQAKLGIKATLNQDKGKIRLRIRKESIPLIKKEIAPYIIPSMLYKLPL
jgi:hypothetical protein